MSETLEKTIVCDRCNSDCTSDHKEFDGEKLCRDCLCNYTVACDNCGGRIWRSEAIGNDNSNSIVCPSCFEEHYLYCTDCRCVVHRDDARYINDNYETP